MGRLALPHAGRIYVDSMVLIYSVEGHPEYCEVLRPLWEASSRAEVHVVSSELALMEVLVGPVRANDTELARRFEVVMLEREMRLLAISLDGLREAARLRAAVPSLRTPDAIHAAAALLAGCSMFLTNDAGLRRVPGLPVTVLDDVRRA